LVYGTKDKIKFWHPGMNAPLALGDVKPNWGARAMAYHDGKLYAGIENKVYDIAEGREIYRTTGRVYSLFSHNGALVSASLIPTGEGSKNQEALSVVDLTDERELLDSRHGMIGGFRGFRLDSLRMNSANGEMLLVSGRIWKVQPLACSFREIGRYIGDYGQLASDGNRAFAVGYGANRDSLEAIELPKFRTVADWPKGDGALQMATLADNDLILGVYDREAKAARFETVSMTKELVNGPVRDAKPELLFMDPEFDGSCLFGIGNPIVAVPRQDLASIVHDLAEKIKSGQIGQN
jgi:hypothetical protein